MNTSIWFLPANCSAKKYLVLSERLSHFPPSSSIILLKLFNSPEASSRIVIPNCFKAFSPCANSSSIFSVDSPSSSNACFCCITRAVIVRIARPNLSEDCPVATIALPNIPANHSMSTPAAFIVEPATPIPLIKP